MARENDLRYFEENRRQLATRHSERWLVFFDGKLQRTFDSEEEAVQFAVENFGVDAASVFHAVEKDPFAYIG